MGYARSAQFYDYFDTKGNSDFYMGLAEETTGDILELGVGTGRVLFEMAKQLRRDVVGIDNSQEMLQQAKRKRRNYYPEVSGRIRLLMEDMVRFELGQTFGFVFSASSGMQGETPDDVRGVCRCVCDHMEPGALFAFDIMSPSAIMQTRVIGPERKEVPGGRVIVRFIAQSYTAGAETASFDILYKEHIPGHSRFTTYKEEAEAAIITPEMIREALDYAGLELEGMYGGFDRRPYDDDCASLVVLARKPA